MKRMWAIGCIFCRLGHRLVLHPGSLEAPKKPDMLLSNNPAAQPGELRTRPRTALLIV